MSNADIRKAHKLLDYVSQGRAVLDDELKLLRSFLPDLPKQKTLEEIAEHVRDAWVGASGNKWAGNSYNREIALESWMGELYVQLKGLKDTPAAEPENVAATVHSLPAGMRIADHEDYGRVVAAPIADSDGERMIFCLDKTSLTGAGRCWAHEDSLTFIDAEPVKPAHPEFLETEADYAAAPEGTIVACEDSPPCHKFGSEWSSVLFCGTKDDRVMSRAIRRVLRWGNE